MCAVVETYILCDAKEVKDCHAAYGKSDLKRTAKEQRRAAWFEGWRYLNGEDVCPACYKKRKEDEG